MSITTRTFNSAKYGKLVVGHQLKRTARWFHTNLNITQDEAQHVQLAVGYHPAGYNFYDFKSNINGTSWKCYNSCD